MKTDRLLAETIYLLQRGRVTSRQMAERFEVSRRTILRDMDALSLAGIPVTSLDGAGGGYQLEESYRLDHRAADRQDVELILVALRALSTAMDDSHLQSTCSETCGRCAGPSAKREWCASPMSAPRGARRCTRWSRCGSITDGTPGI